MYYNTNLEKKQVLFVNKFKKMKFIAVKYYKQVTKLQHIVVLCVIKEKADN